MNQKPSLSTTLSLLIFGISLQASTLQNLETATALLRGPANMGALYSLTNDSPHAYRYKIAADITRITNDLLSIANSNKDYKLQIPHFQQALRIVQASSNIIKTLATVDNADHHIPRHQQVLHALFLLETLAAGYVSQLNDDVQEISSCQTYHNLHTLISQTQFITELLLEKEWNEAACLDGAFLAASLADKISQCSYGLQQTDPHFNRTTRRGRTPSSAH